MKGLFRGISIIALLAGGEAVGATFETDDMTYSFSHEGRLVSAREKAGGRELVVLDTPWVRVTTADGKVEYATALRQDGDRLSFSFAGGEELVEKVASFDGGLSFTVEKCTFDSPREVVIAHLRPAVTNYVGDIANALSDDQSGICLRGGDYETEMSGIARKRLTVGVPGRFSAVGKRAFLTAGPRTTLVGKLKKLVKATGLSWSPAGGPWSADPGVVHGSYVFADVTAENVDTWIRLARLAGVSIIHLYVWEESRGHYGIDLRRFPRGLDDLKAAADRIHAAGLGFSLHTLTGCIDYRDAWATPKAHPDFMSLRRYTLAQPLTEASTEVVVNEEPGPEHGTPRKPTMNGHVLDIGGELVAYKDVRREKPYAFTGIERGWNKTTKADHPAGTSVKYLHNWNFSFYPEPDSQLAVDLATALAGVINATGADMFYLDGSEAMRTPYGMARLATMIYDRVDQSKRPVWVEMSCHQPHFWPIRALFEAWDRAVFAPKAFADRHIASNRRGGLKANFLKPQIGWWSPTTAEATHRGFFPDEVEYFAARMAGCDATVSLQRIHPSRDGVLPVAIIRSLATIGLYERFRVAGAFAPDVLKRMDTEGMEGRLRQDAKGEWTYTPVTVVSSMKKGEGVGGRGSFTSESASEAALRVEMLYNLATEGGVPVFNAALLDRFAQKTADKVTLKATSAEDPEHGATVALKAYNDTASPRGAWARLARWEKPPYLNCASTAGVGFWVRGDGSGAILDVRFSTPGESYHCDADHLVRLDFKGWKYVELLFRERDTDQASRLQWDVTYDRAPFGTDLHPERIAGVSVWLNEIPVSQREGILDSNSEDRASRPASVDIALGEIRALSIRAAEAEDVSVKLNGKRIEVPFDFEAGDYAELDDGVWSLYAEQGELKKRQKGPRLTVAKGLNDFRLKGDAEDNAAFRGAVTFIVKGAPRPALRPLTEAMKAVANYEVELPMEWAPSRGATALAPVRVRPGERAKIEVTLRGPVADPVLSVQDGTGWIDVKLPSVAAKKLVVFTDGPVVTGVRKLKMSSSDPTGAEAVVEVAKRYER